MTPTAAKSTGKVWHVMINEQTLCRGKFLKPGRVKARPVDEVPAYRLCQLCERAVSQLDVAVRTVQS